MATNIFTKAGGRGSYTDLDDIFDAYWIGTKAGATGIVVGGQDLSDRYCPLSVGTAAADTGIYVGGTDLSASFAASGTAYDVRYSTTDPKYYVMFVTLWEGLYGWVVYWDGTAVWSGDPTTNPDPAASEPTWPVSGGDGYVYSKGDWQYGAVYAVKRRPE